MITAAHPATGIARVAAVHPDRSDARVALLGLGRIGTAVARLAQRQPAGLDRRIRVSGALVRQTTARTVTAHLPITSDFRALIDQDPDVIVEVLGGLEPARTLVLQALGRGIPVVTANKSLLAAHGDELFEAAARAGVSLRYEASVLAGVPFLGTFQQRPFAAAIDRLCGIVNGTSNFVLSQLEDGRTDLAAAICDAQRRGFAEPDPTKDLTGIDAAEKLAVLVRHFGHISLPPGAIETRGLGGLTPADLEHAREFGGAIKPIALAGWSDEPTACVGPMFVDAGHPLASLRGVLNGIVLSDGGARPLFFSGPGAGPDATATTILDDVVETVRDRHLPHIRRRARAAQANAPRRAAWFVRLTFPAAPPDGSDISDLLAAHSVWPRRTSAIDTRGGTNACWLMTYACETDRLRAAVDAVSAATRCGTFAVRVLEDSYV